jgi:hypothetical protein
MKKIFFLIIMLVASFAAQAAATATELEGSFKVGPALFLFLFW